MGLTMRRGHMNTPLIETRQQSKHPGNQSKPAIKSPHQTKHPASKTGCFRCLGKDLNLGPAD